ARGDVGVGLGEAVGVQQQGVAGGEGDGGGGDACVLQHPDELPSRRGQVVGGAVGAHQQGGRVAAAGQGDAEAARVGVQGETAVDDGAEARVVVVVLVREDRVQVGEDGGDRKSTRLNSSHVKI